MFGRKQKFAEAYSDHYAVVFGAVYNKVSSIEDAEDICHDLFVRFYEKMDSIDNYRKWLLVALRLEVLAFYRKKRPEVVDPESLFEDISLSFVNGLRDTRVIIEEAFDKIEEIHGEHGYLLFDMVALKRFSYEEAGKQLGINARQVRYRYGEIIRWLQDYLGKKGIHSMEDLL